MQERLSGKERTALMLYVTALEGMHRMEDCMDKRIKSQKGAWRDFKLAMAMHRKTMQTIRGTMTDKDGTWITRIVQKGRVAIDMEGPFRMPDYLIVDSRDMAHISCLAAKHECGLCVRTGKEIKRCKLRQVLLDATPPQEFVDGVCEYSMVNWDDEDEEV